MSMPRPHIAPVILRAPAFDSDSLLLSSLVISGITFDLNFDRDFELSSDE
jgi:hypothetical protein